MVELRVSNMQRPWHSCGCPAATKAGSSMARWCALHAPSQSACLARCTMTLPGVAAQMTCQVDQHCVLTLIPIWVTADPWQQLLERSHAVFLVKLLLTCRGYVPRGPVLVMQFEKMDAKRPGEPGGEGEYKVQTGFGWSNGVVLQLLSQYGWHPELLQVQRPWQITVSCSCSPRSFPEDGKRANAISKDESLAPVHTLRCSTR